MTARIEAIFEHGVFRPTEPVSIAEGERVQLVVVSPDEPIEPQSPASVLAEIAALPLESTADESVARNHDRYLYGADRP